MSEFTLKSGFAGDTPAGITRTQIDTLLVAAFASTLSMLHTGFVFGIDNNIFHLPITAGLYDEPQFHDDAFIQSLRYFASGVWLLLSHVEHYLNHTAALFLGLTWLSRLLSFLGFLCCASLVGITTRIDKIVFSLVVCITSFLEGGSFAGLGGLFLNYFTHSELANGIILLAIYAAAKRRFTAATLLVGVTFFINAFAAVWLIAIIAAVAADLLARNETTIRTVLGRTLAGLLPTALLALPVLINIASNPEIARPLDFDYATYLRQYFAEHSLIDSIAGSDLLALAAIELLGAVALSELGTSARALGAAYGGAVLLYVLGIALSLISNSPNILNLQLLRSGTVIHLLAGLAIAALATRWLRDAKDRSFAFGGVSAVLLSAPANAFALCIPVVLAAPSLLRVQPTTSPLMRGIGFAALAFATLILFPFSAWQNLNAALLLIEARVEWTAIGNWARDATVASAMFLVPPGARDHGPQEMAGTIALTRVAIFEATAHRRIWVDYKRGAAAMWTPSYYHIWRTRSLETSLLTSLDQRLNYARNHSIDYVIDLCEAVPATPHPLFRTARLCVLPAQPPAADATL